VMASEDVQRVVKAFVDADSFSFARFKSIWSSLKMSFLQMAPDAFSNTGRLTFQQNLYLTALGYLSSERAVEEQIGGLFALYCLYKTQPKMTNTGEPYLPIRIDITPGELESLIKLHQQALQEPVNRDAVEVFRWFCRSKDEVFAFISGRPEQKSQGPIKHAMYDPAALEGVDTVDTLAGVQEQDTRLAEVSALYTNIRSVVGLPTSTEALWDIAPGIKECLLLRRVPAAAKDNGVAAVPPSAAPQRMQHPKRREERRQGISQIAALTNEDQAMQTAPRLSLIPHPDPSPAMEPENNTGMSDDEDFVQTINDALEEVEEDSASGAVMQQRKKKKTRTRT